VLCAARHSRPVGSPRAAHYTPSRISSARTVRRKIGIVTPTYLPQSYPLFVAARHVALPANIGELDVYDAKAAVAKAVVDQLDIERVVAWLIEDAPKGEVTAKPVTMVGLGVPFTVAESPDEVRRIMSERGMATAARERPA
jgi:hypothetical protein